MACWLLSAATALAEPRTVRVDQLTVTIPDGYRDISDEIRRAGFPRPQITLQARQPHDDLPLITFQRVPVYGGNLADPAICRWTAGSVAGPTGKVRNASIVPGPTGPTCQIDILYPEAVGLMTDVNGARETWLMTCNYADGDAAAEKACRATLASLHPGQGFGRPDPETTYAVRVLHHLTWPFVALGSSLASH